MVKPLLITVIGDGNVGKTAFIIRYLENRFPEEYVPTVMGDYVKKNAIINNETYDLNFIDTAGQEEYDKLRVMQYTKTDVFIVCFDLNKRDTFQNIRDKWIPELNKYKEKAATILLGTKNDLENFVPPKDIEKLRSSMGAFKYIACSAKNNTNIKDAVTFAVMSTIAKQDKRPRCIKCVIQ